MKTAKQIQAELDAYLASKTEKDLNVNDNKIIAAVSLSKNKDIIQKRRLSCIETNKKEETKKKYAIRNSNFWSDKEQADKRINSIKQTYDKPENRIKLKKNPQKYIVANGIPFESQNDACKYYDITSGHMTYLKKKHPDQYYNITREEYDKLKGQS